MANSNEFSEWSSFTCDEETLMGFNQSLQEGLVSTRQSNGYVTKGVMNDHVLCESYPPASDNVQLSQEQAAWQGTLQAPSIPMAIEQQHNYQLPQNVQGGQYWALDRSLYDPYADLYSSKLLSQPERVASEQELPVSDAVRESL